ncbi:MAG: DNA alkylation repair protein [Candidatus Kapaibacterium sp.]
MAYHEIIERLTLEFEQASNLDAAGKMAQYMRNLFPFYGISKPKRAEIVKPILKQLVAISTTENYEAIARELWNKLQREFHYVSIEYLEKVEKLWGRQSSLELFENMIVTKSWWDSVDTIASHCVGKYFQKWKDDIPPNITRWNLHENMWLNRTAIIFQLSYKSKTDTALLAHVIDTHSKSKEFFIQKAIGWALRQYAYTDANYVRTFVETHALAPLSRREALKNMAKLMGA